MKSGITDRCAADLLRWRADHSGRGTHRLAESMAVARTNRTAGSDAFMVEELRIERERSKLDLEQLTNLLDGGEAGTRTRRRTGS